ncbi:phosphotransferase enzyme family protein [Flavilitoribacter nigricans]|uniref:Aminoglycoside phosphotransferase domain-containing protein n=1 Tax=Flavilitoribacter nigricans (strain ATCC 23147 / DSM 23189 / NBRC 102662 / NCIMB 1420 / SS-2) TaxID=1122177 RepID=A0A2D0N1Z7_FLAN2|nr:phosphotransferase [Flavilitoribacter nigricans]PHN02551.1 hypothetical protein CRP01_31745 [Flavilitoribacter nigricans DSM 23189 = NBRC 102662]
MNEPADEILKASCGQYNLDHKKAKLVRNHHNYVYECEDKFLKITGANFRSYDEIANQIYFTEQLSRNGIKVVETISTTSGQSCVEIKGAARSFTAMCFRKITGRKFGKEDLNRDHFRRMGKFVGKLHSTANSMKLEASFRKWDEIFINDSAEFLPEKANIRALYERLYAELKTYSEDGKVFGMIHYDFHSGNYLIDQQGDIVLFDFELSCRSWYANEIGVILFWIRRLEKIEKRDELERFFLSEFWQGYESEFEMRQDEKRKIYKFALFRGIQVYGYLEQQFPGNEKVARLKETILESIHLLSRKI